MEVLPHPSRALRPSPCRPLPSLTITAPKHTEPNYNAWPNHQEYLDAVTKDVPTMVACHLKVSHIRIPAHTEHISHEVAPPYLGGRGGGRGG